VVTGALTMKITPDQPCARFIKVYYKGECVKDCVEVDTDVPYFKRLKRDKLGKAIVVDGALVFDTINDKCELEWIGDPMEANIPVELAPFIDRYKVRA
jgi:hypothetical protein